MLFAAGAVALGGAGAASAGTVGSITGIAPNSGPTAGGTSITISLSGVYFAFSPVVTVGGADATVTSSQYGRIVATTPPGVAGQANVIVLEDVGQGRVEKARLAGGFTYVAPAPAGPAITVTGVSRASGLTTGGESITITGSGFSGGSAPTVSLGGTAATAVTVVSDTTITATTPARAAGTVDVTVSRDGGTGTRAGAYTYLQAYWLTVTNSQPPGTGASTAKSTGAVTTSGGTWASKQTKGEILLFTRTEYRNFAGGLNCGNRVERKTLFGFNFLGSETVWDGGPCRYAFPAGTRVALSALPSSATSLLPGFFEDHWAGLFNKWTGACTGTTSECIVTMNADRSTRATWGRFAWGLISGTATATPVFADDGSLSYSVLTVAFVPQANAVTGTPTYSMVSTFTTGASAAARDTAARQLSACRGAARASGRGLEARCTPTPALAAALRKGPVRVTTKWYLRAPRQKATYPLGQARAHLANRRAGAVTG
jgi:hypothetical protein